MPTFHLALKLSHDLALTYLKPELIRVPSRPDVCQASRGYSHTIGVVSPKSRILCHRGLWDSPLEGNSLESILRAISEGFGVEFDVRDSFGEVVIAHDPPVEEFRPPTLTMLLEKLAKIEADSNMAINMKSDGLEPLIHSISVPHFFFDMSFPDQLSYQKAKRRLAIRVSEYEPLFASSLSSRADVIWIDAFQSDWYLEENVFERLLQEEATKVFVSPELHGRNYEGVWSALRPLFLSRNDIMICTDQPRLFLESL